MSYFVFVGYVPEIPRVQDVDDTGEECAGNQPQPFESPINNRNTFTGAVSFTSCGQKNVVKKCKLYARRWELNMVTFWTKFTKTMEHDSKCTMNNCESEEIVEAANIAISNLLPTKSRSLYDIAYNRFKKWCAEENVQVYSENVLLAYFSENAKNYKSSTLWAQYSMVKSCDNLRQHRYKQIPQTDRIFEKNR
ncbi:hypothetical protein NQ317_008863 [Molorchus minor]|uniref:Uncharacterized protein n=1 Tax=Molorchus minor TaxID=1323400 RepID=A0ABQ9J3Y8_9CUCU|nr:hypothetical protein NQ317_008863 [Molorchus minor]